MLLAADPALGRSKTEPSTPLRNIALVSANVANYSAPLRSRVSPVYLPPQELLPVISGMSLRQASIPPEDPPKWRSGANSRRSSYSLSRPTSQGHTPTKRRLSDHLTIRRRRRSSAGMVYDAGYVGPVTRGFLRAFSRALLSENHDSEDEVYKALDEQHQRQLTSPADMRNEFDYSLPLPDDDVMMSPYERTAHVNILPESLQKLDTETLRKSEPNKSEKQESQKAALGKPVFKSYLERILESRNRKHTHASMFEPELTNHVHEVINTSKFVIENTLSGLPEYSSSQNALSQDFQLAEPVAFGSMSDTYDSNNSSDKENIPHPRMRRHSGLGESTATVPLGVSDVSHWGPVELDSSSIMAPTLGNPFGAELNESLEEDDIDNVGSMDLDSMDMQNIGHLDQFESVQPDHIDPDVENNGNVGQDLDLSMEGLVLGHFTIDNDDIDTNDADELHLQPALEVDNSSPTIPQKRVLGPSLAPKRRKQGPQNAMPKSLVRGLVSLARNVPGQDGPRPRGPTTDRIPPALMQQIAVKSNEFLHQVMLDLGAYAGHRNSNQITIQDAVLYLNRIKSHGRSASAVDNISVLVKSVFPLELLVSLDNSLQESVNKRIRQQRTDTSEDDPLFDIPPTESPAVSEVRSDEDLDLEWEDE